jgi:hypothetical protein
MPGDKAAAAADAATAANSAAEKRRVGSLFTIWQGPQWHGRAARDHRRSNFVGCITGRSIGLLSKLLGLAKRRPHRTSSIVSCSSVIRLDIGVWCSPPQARLEWREPGTRGCTCTLTSGRQPCAECCREVTNGGLSGQGQRVRSSDHAYKIAARESSIPETRGNVLGTSAGRKARERSTFENDRENEPDMTTYPLEFHRRSEQKWVPSQPARAA